jgi:hypothetical protein
VIRKGEQQVKYDDYKIHPAAELFPLVEGEDFDEFVEDMRKVGRLHDPIVTMGEGDDLIILDGRNRLRACEALKIEPRFTPYQGDDPVGYIISANLMRRHLDKNQRALIGAKLANMRQGERTDIKPSANLRKVSQSDAAKKMKVSTRTVASASKVLKKGAPELLAAVHRGNVPVSKGADIADLPHEEQAAAIESAMIRRESLDLAPELAEVVEQMKLPKAAVKRLATLSKKEQIKLTKGPDFETDIQRKANKLLRAEQKAKDEQKKQKDEADREAARVAKVRQEAEQHIIDVIVPALVASDFDRDTQKRIYDVANNWSSRLGDALFAAFNLPGEEDLTQEAAE